MPADNPSIGRIVIFRHPSSKDTKQPILESPAIVLKVNDDETVDIVIFPVVGGSPWNRFKIEHGDGEYQWSWPTREAQVHD